MPIKAPQPVQPRTAARKGVLAAPAAAQKLPIARKAVAVSKTVATTKGTKAKLMGKAASPAAAKRMRAINQANLRAFAAQITAQISVSAARADLARIIREVSHGERVYEITNEKTRGAAAVYLVSAEHLRARGSDAAETTPGRMLSEMLAELPSTTPLRPISLNTPNTGHSNLVRASQAARN